MTISRDLSFLKGVEFSETWSKMSKSHKNSKLVLKNRDPDKEAEKLDKEVKISEQLVAINLQIKPKSESNHGSVKRKTQEKTNENTDDKEHSGSGESLSKEIQGENNKQTWVLAEPTKNIISEYRRSDPERINQKQLQRYEIKGKDYAVSSLKKIQDGKSESGHKIDHFT